MEHQGSFLKSEVAAFETQSREGYFGDASATMDSNAGCGPRIVLGERYGLQKLGMMDLSDEQAAKQLAGCQGRYAGKVVVITGAGRGIGAGCARVFFEAGSHVVICDRSDDGSVLADELNDRKAENHAFFVRADVSKTVELEGLVKATVERFGRLDCIVNNAGWHPPARSIDDFSVDEMQNLLQLNFLSTFALCKFALPHLRRVTGNIINISSLVGHFGQANATTYAATKGAVTSFTKALAIDEAKHKVRVNSVSPGNIWTPLWKAGADAEQDPTAAIEAGNRVQVLQRMGTVLETGRLCLCIAADLTFTTGVDHILSGGAELGYGLK